MSDIKEGLLCLAKIALSEGCKDSQSAIKFLTDMTPGLTTSSIFLNVFPIAFDMVFAQHMLDVLAMKSKSGIEEADTKSQYIVEEVD